MDVRIIKNSIPAQYDSAIGDIVLQISEGNQKIGEITSKKYTLFYVDSNVMAGRTGTYDAHQTLSSIISGRYAISVLNFLIFILQIV